MRLSAQWIATVGVCLALFSSRTAHAQEQEPRVDLYTMGPGTHPFSRFGHAALCVHDAETPYGRCFNFGTTDFSTPGPLTLDFFRGRARFWVSVLPLSVMMELYRLEDRSVYRQPLPLSPAQTQALIRDLNENLREDRRYYFYHHFADNCSTRLRDAIDRVTNGAFRTARTQVVPATYRSYVRTGFMSHAPLQLGQELLMGRRFDAPMTRWDAMFLPDVLREEVLTQLHAPPTTVYRRRAELPGGDPLLGVRWLPAFGVLLGVLAALAQRFSGPWVKRFSLVPTALLLGLPGLFVWALALFSPVPELHYNDRILALWPTDLALPFLSEKRRTQYALLRLVVLVLCVLTPPWSILQRSHAAPLLAALALLPLAYTPTKEEKETVSASAE